MQKFPKRRLASIASRVAPNDGYSEFRIALDSIEQWSGKMSPAEAALAAGPGAEFKAGDILFGKLRPYLAKAWVADREGVYYGDFVNIRPRKGISPTFLGYAIRTPGFISEATAAAIGSKMPRTEWQSLREIRVHTPGVVTQRTIADYLDRETAEIDALIGDLDGAGKLLEERRRATIEAAITGVTVPSAPLKRFGHIQTGITLGSTYPGEDTQEYPYIRVANVQVGRVDTEEMKTVAVPQRVARTTSLEEGDVLLTEGGDRDKLGRGALWTGSPERTLHQNHVFAFRCNELLMPEYLVYTLEASRARRYFDVTARQSTNLASTNSSIVLAFPLANPRLDRQAEIVRDLAEKQSLFEQEQADLARAIALAKERRAALITAAVTGQIDVTATHRPAAEQLADDIKELT